MANAKTNDLCSHFMPSKISPTPLRFGRSLHFHFHIEFCFAFASVLCFFACFFVFCDDVDIVFSLHCFFPPSTTSRKLGPCLRSLFLRIFCLLLVFFLFFFFFFCLRAAANDQRLLPPISVFFTAPVTLSPPIGPLAALGTLSCSLLFFLLLSSFKLSSSSSLQL